MPERPARSFPGRPVADRLSLSMRASHLLVVLLVVAGLALAALGSALGDTFYLRLATEALIYAGLALSVDILLGYTGLLSLGQALYFGIGAYVSALTLMAVPSFWLALLAASGATLVAALIGGVIANRVRGVYFALITFGLAQVVAKVVYNTRELGASDGMIGVPVVEVPLGPFHVSTGSAPGFLLVALALLVLLYAVSAYLLDTPFGRVLIALKANERRVAFLGYSTWRARMAAYVLAALVAGLSGALYPMLRGFVSPELLYFQVSGNAVITVVVGGVGTLVGPIYGAILLTVLKSVIGSWTEHQLIVIGVLFMASVLFLPQGLIGLLRPRLARWLGRAEPPPAKAAEAEARP
ncbi:amino acid/amide ABC transporter membrane protein 2, HAAT family [Tistlia consotensis]|uniref:Amino acid/amide ABC transporter membrane protein 2, HAAT family n=1 Tax=Tistlia consotensis USBA 355 TaxID=560819 RepID=A0A1Y6CVH3_9PROT|nr:branched-chain amino acid ABC transporter permease [Tistlia consotensis]SMF80212.1 amino acid/amide ABC transporter membrane protein 2, HAAT family [Tistlia consotensis USBA 355]SNR62280.1 amino acid/amide ABC transporter membrane protein 2, HAAT family [Tistlia consotensis]